ncbi:hypothetical protein KIN20_006966 [Parelaphostrongylus tenuis]|uniref:Uncharacterized protein n=1 Tax=Parelaphostrongylus tenuis TaxID=148309 RepID=A0AAD5M2L7_PARTN|nr:hypothetical protein KIN20_006966 [Parelaphostrongylus tenuis]
MRASLQNSEQDDEVPQDPAPILSVLCSLVDEIGSLRTENRRLKTRLAPPLPRSKEPTGFECFQPRLTEWTPVNAPEWKVEASGSGSIQDNVVQRMSAIFDSHTNIFPRLRRATHAEIRTGARERLTTPPRKTSRLRSVHQWAVPSSGRKNQPEDPMSTSSISTDLSQLSTRTRAPPLVEPELSDSEIEGDYPPPRPVSYYPVDDSDDSDNLRTKVKANSFLNVHNNYNHPENLLRVDRETKLRHDKQNLEVEIEELKMRNQRLVEQLRDKSVQFSKLQFHAQQLNEQVMALSQRCALNAALDKLTLDERLIKGTMGALEKVEDRLRHLQHQIQCAKLDAVNAQQKTLNNLTNERNARNACLERLEQLQRENFALMQSRYLESGCNDSLWKRKIDALPSYETLYGFTQQVLRKYTDLKWSLVDKDREMSRAELDLIAAQSSLLVTHAQNERLRMKLGESRRRRPSSFHGEDLLDRIVKRDMDFFLPFKLQGSRIENSKRILNKKSNDHEKDLELEFHNMFGDGRHAVPLPPTLEKPPSSASSRIEYMMREMSSSKNRKILPAFERAGPIGQLFHAIGKSGSVAGTCSSHSTINGTTGDTVWSKWKNNVVGDISKKTGEA